MIPFFFQAHRNNDLSVEADMMLDRRWVRFQRWMLRRFGKETDVESTLFLIGLQELGKGVPSDMDKRKREQVIMEGSYCALETLGYYERTGVTATGHWIWEQRTLRPDDLSGSEEERILREAILCYFDKNHPSWTHES